MTTNSKTPNRLINEKSPYLLQHAHNPVDWHPWGEEAFNLATKEDKPIFLSIGYSTCHWCHVMEKESFEDQEVANLLNDAFICIKVDREERPDLDNVYMTVSQITTGSGGWPLNLVLTPDLKPFYVDTYIPKESNYAKPGLKQLVPKLKHLWQDNRHKLTTAADNIVSVLQDTTNTVIGKHIDKDFFRRAFEQLHSHFDTERGGFGQAPKFPTPHNLIFLFRYWKESGDDLALEMAEKTLYAMRLGGIYDHAGFGFHRYSTDPDWLLPHFEKMLYDQAMLALAYLEGYEATRNSFYLETAEEIFTYVLRDLRSPEGGFYTGEDADSEGVEGKFYVWSEKEIRQILSEDDAELFINIFNIKPEGNFLDEARKIRSGKNILHLKEPLSKLASDKGLPEIHMKNNVKIMLEKLFKARIHRIHPHKDDKILTDWNGLMIAALAKGARLTSNKAYLNAAINATKFILTNLSTDNYTLSHDYRNNITSKYSFLDDYAFFIFGLIELYETTFDFKYLKIADELSKKLVDEFDDAVIGGFYFSSFRNNEVLVRKKEVYDGAIPSGNSIAAYNFLRLARIMSNTYYEELALKTGQAFSNIIKQYPAGYTMFLTALSFAIYPCFEIVIATPSYSEQTDIMLAKINDIYLPNKTITVKEDLNSDLIHLVESLRDLKPLNNLPTAYVCKSYGCKQPTTDPEELSILLK